MSDPFDSFFKETHPGGRASWELDDYYAKEDDESENTDDLDSLGVSI